MGMIKFQIQNLQAQVADLMKWGMFQHHRCCTSVKRWLLPAAAWSLSSRRLFTAEMLVIKISRENVSIMIYVTKMQVRVFFYAAIFIYDLLWHIFAFQVTDLIQTSMFPPHRDYSCWKTLFLSKESVKTAASYIYTKCQIRENSTADQDGRMVEHEMIQVMHKGLQVRASLYHFEASISHVVKKPFLWSLGGLVPQGVHSGLKSGWVNFTFTPDHIITLRYN
jgi:hypothetical protein